MKRTSAITLGIVSTMGVAVIAFGIWHHMANQQADRLAYQQWRSDIQMAEEVIMPPRHVPHFVPSFNNIVLAAMTVSHGSGIIAGLGDQQSQSAQLQTVDGVAVEVNTLFQQAISDPATARQKWAVLLTILRTVKGTMPRWGQMQTFAGKARVSQVNKELLKNWPL